MKVLLVFFQYHTWYFVPDDQEKYVMKPTLIVSGVKLHAKSSGGKKRSFVLRAVGEGSTGQMRVLLFQVKILVSKRAFNQLRFLRTVYTYHQCDRFLYRLKMGSVRSCDVVEDF